MSSVAALRSGCAPRSPIRWSGRATRCRRASLDLHAGLIAAAPGSDQAGACRIRVQSAGSAAPAYKRFRPPVALASLRIMAIGCLDARAPVRLVRSPACLKRSRRCDTGRRRVSSYAIMMRRYKDPHNVFALQQWSRQVRHAGCHRTQVARFAKLYPPLSP